MSGYFDMAQSYGSAAQRLAPRSCDCRLPFLMLVAHALELSCKAILERTGVDGEMLMMIGHNLDSCYARVTSAGLPRSTAVEQLVEALADPHRYQSLRYPSRIFNAPVIDADAAATTLSQHLSDTGRFLSELSHYHGAVAKDPHHQ